MKYYSTNKSHEEILEDILKDLDISILEENQLRQMLDISPEKYDDMVAKYEEAKSGWNYIEGVIQDFFDIHLGHPKKCFLNDIKNCELIVLNIRESCSDLVVHLTELYERVK